MSKKVKLRSSSNDENAPVFSANVTFCNSIVEVWMSLRFRAAAWVPAKF